MKNCATIANTRDRVTAALRGMGFRVLDSKTNFIFAESDGIAGGELYAELKKRGVLIRHFGNEKIKNFNRITIGTDAEMDVFLEKTREILGR